MKLVTGVGELSGVKKAPAGFLEEVVDFNSCFGFFLHCGLILAQRCAVNYTEFAVNPEPTDYEAARQHPLTRRVERCLRYGQTAGFRVKIWKGGKKFHIWAGSPVQIFASKS